MFLRLLKLPVYLFTWGDWRTPIVVGLCILLAAQVPVVAFAAEQPLTPPLNPAVYQDLNKALDEGYLDLFKQAAKLEFSQSQLDTMADFLDKAQDSCKGRFKDLSDKYDKQLTDAQENLKKRTRTIDDKERSSLHCSIQTFRRLKNRADTIENQAIPNAFANREAKLKLIEEWPEQEREAKQEIASGDYMNRRWSDVKDIGFREIGKGQKDDIKAGEDAVEQMKREDLMPPEVKNEEVDRYVKDVALKVAAHSDLRVPLHVTVLNSKEVNAFALPGGFLFVDRGLLEKVDDESELAGVLGHEMGHVVARHGHQLMKRSTIEGIFFQMAQVAALVLTGGVAGIGNYYALQYGFEGLGLLLSLDLLGVSRDFELQADQLGIQYTWNAGYDPSGFIRFFDKMATKEGYVTGLSWFRTHPPFYERMVDAEKEIMFLPKKKNLTVNTEAFKKMKTELTKVTKQAAKDEKDRPSLLEPLKGCQVPPNLKEKPEERMEQVCPVAFKTD